MFREYYTIDFPSIIVSIIHIINRLLQLSRIYRNIFNNNEQASSLNKFYTILIYYKTQAILKLNL